ncbi:actin-like protein ARP8 [Phyllosticta citrichinensis]|uniref:Actin-like protein ARP8 n=1 Tax=Phyllosticta citrichinensis TaxID=1130410 RepID=A0ABR1XJ29_9PEZI
MLFLGYFFTFLPGSLLTALSNREYLKRDDQFLAYRTQNEEATNRMVQQARDKDRALAQGVEVPEDENADENGQTVATQEAFGSKIVVIHPGSQNLRIGLASDILPKTVPMVIARKWAQNEAEEAGEPKPKRVKVDGQEPEEPDQLFGPEFSSQFSAMSTELKLRMRANKRRVLPNSKELVVNYNKRSSPEIIKEHNDPHRIEWTELPPNPRDAPDYLLGQAALRIPEESNPRYKLFWPIKHGWFNEQDYSTKTMLFQDIALIIEHAVISELGLKHKKDWSQYGCVCVIPDLYEKRYVCQMLDILLRDIGFGRVCFQQESLSATFGAGYSSSCIVDIGAQKTSICCVEEGLCIEDSRVNLKYGGVDVMDTFIRMMLHDYFPYADINLRRRYDFLLAEELMHKFCTMNEGDISVQHYDFHLRAFGKDTKKYFFKTYDETMLAPMGYFVPTIFDHSEKLKGRRKLIPPSFDLYDGSPNDPQSAAQSAILQIAAQSQPGVNGEAPTDPPSRPPPPPVASTPSRSNPVGLVGRFNEEQGTPRSSVAGSPGPEGTPQPPRETPMGGEPGAATSGIFEHPSLDKIKAAEARDRILPFAPLDTAIMTSIQNGARGDDRKARDFYGGIMITGGGSKIPLLMAFLESKLKERLPGISQDILIGTPPRDLDPQVLVWKGGSVFGKLSPSGNDSWISQKEPPNARTPRALTSLRKQSVNMASSARAYHQDYIARIRYSNALPPPPIPPKLLEIPNTGLASGEYTSAGYASRLAREQPLNIEADAELGMPIDLIGLPGVFEGDDAAIMASENPDQVDIKDRPLLRPLSTLGKPTTASGGSTFLRRTEYITASGGGGQGVFRDSNRVRKPKRRVQTDEEKNEPINILRNIMKGFDIQYPEDAYKGHDTTSNLRAEEITAEEKRAWQTPRHPSKPGLKLLDSYPLLPDLDALPEPGSYIVTKFQTNPVSQGDKYDERVNVGIFRILEPDLEAQAEYQRKTAEAEADPTKDAPMPEFDYEFFLPGAADSVRGIKRKFDVLHPQRDEPDLYDSENPETGKRFFRYDRLRAYETYQQTGNAKDPYDDTVALALHDANDKTGSNLTKAAYFYPVMQRTFIRPKRKQTRGAMAMARQDEEEDNRVDALEVEVRDLDEGELELRRDVKARLVAEDEV